MDGVTSVNDVIYQNDIPVVDVDLVVSINADEPGGLGAAVGGDEHEVHGHGAVDLAHEVGEEDHAAAQEAEEEQAVGIAVIGGDLGAEFGHALFDLLLRDQNLPDEIIRIRGRLHVRHVAALAKGDYGICYHENVRVVITISESQEGKPEYN